MNESDDGTVRSSDGAGGVPVGGGVEGTGRDAPRNDAPIAKDHQRSRPEYVDFSVEDFPGGLRSCIEAILMAAGHPQHEEDLARVLAVDEASVAEALADLQADYDGMRDASAAAMGMPRGFALRHTARGWQLVSRLEFEPVVAAFVTDGQTARLSQAALEALAIVAYKQPVTRARVAAIRGVNSDGVIRSLSVRGLIREEGTDPDSRAALLATTALFLEQLGLDSLDQLPSLAPFLPAVSDIALDGAAGNHGADGDAPHNRG